MDQVFPDDGLVQAALNMLGTGIQYRLYTNDVTPTLFSVVGDFSEAAFGGYVPVALTVADFGLVQVLNHVGIIQAAAIAFQNTSGGNVTCYGYFVLDDQGNVLAAARFDSAPLVRADGESFIIIPIFGDLSSAF